MNATAYFPAQVLILHANIISGHAVAVMAQTAHTGTSVVCLRKMVCACCAFLLRQQCEALGCVA